MSIEREVPLNYQITVTNVITIGTKSMADFYVSFGGQSGREWKSPIVHGRVTKENTRYPWIFTVDSHQLTINFHEIDDKNGTDRVVGSMPLLLMKREGEEEFLIFGCTENNRGRKVAEVEFTYVQCSVAASLNSNKKTQFSNEQSKRISLEYTIEVENYDNKKGLNMIPEQTENEIRKESIVNSKLALEHSDSLIDQQDFHPSKLETLKAETNRNKILSEDSNFELNLIKEMEDATDRWYRNNFGREKPTNLDNYEFDNQNSRMVSILYEKDYEYLNDIKFTNPHMEIKNIMIHSDKKPKAIELYSIDMDGSQLIKDKIASVQNADGYKYDWANAIRLPKEAKAYGLEIITADKERLQGLILKDSNHNKNSLEIYNRKGVKVGKANYMLKEIKKIEIQTFQLMELQPIPQEKQITNELDKSFLKSINPKTQQKQESLLQNDTLIRIQDFSLGGNRGKNKLIKEIYLNRQREEPPQLATQPRGTFSQELKEKIEVRRQMNNQAYLNRQVSPSPKSKKSLRKNQFDTEPRQASQTPSKFNKNTAKVPYLQQTLTIKNQPQFTPISQSNIIGNPSNSINQFLPSQNSKMNQQLSEGPIISEDPHEQSLSKKILELKKIGDDLGKKAKAFPSKKFSKTSKYKTVIYNEQKEDESPYMKGSLENSDSGKELQNHKKLYREPINANVINATPSFQSSLINNTFSKQQEREVPKIKIGHNIMGKANDASVNQIDQTHLNSSDLNQISDESQQVPITRHKTADQNLLKTMIQQADIKLKKESQIRDTQPIDLKQDRKANSFGVNTERMSIVNNVLQSTFVPTTQKRTSPLVQKRKSLESEENEGWEGKLSSKEEIASIRDSLMDNPHKTKYSSQTIQPATQLPPGKLNYLITSISVSYYENTFGNKFLKVYIPNKHYYQTTLISNSNTLFWKCKGFLFSNVHDHQDLYIQIYNSVGDEQKMLGRVILNSREFHPQAEQAVVRAYLIIQSRVVGEVVLGYQAVSKSLARNQRSTQFERELSNQREAVSQSHFNQSKKQTTPIKRKRKKRNTSLNDSLTQFLRKNRKEKINRYLVNEYSRAHIDSRINPNIPKRFTNGKNIVIGRDVRFPFSPEEELKVSIPGPGAYRQKSQFERYNRRLEKQK